MASANSTFTVDVVGEITGEKWVGSFTTRLQLSHADQFRRDEIRRRLLGANPESASPRALNAAEVFSEISIHITDAPQWWKGNNGGLDLADDNVVAAVFDGIVAEKTKAAAETKKRADAALEELKKTAPVTK
jgi:hypothetical protein